MDGIENFGHNKIIIFLNKKEEFSNRFQYFYIVSFYHS